MRAVALLLAAPLLLLLLTAGASFAEAPDEAPSVTPVELEARLASRSAPVVIDVRTSAEFATGHIPGAVNIPFDEVAGRIAELDTPHGVALYCMMGPRARKGESALLASGYTSVVHLEGGLAAWQAAGLPVLTEEATPPRP